MKHSVLFVDDDETLLAGLKRMLRPMRDEWEMTFISNPTEAIQAMRNTCFDVVVTDMRMPSIDGAALLAEVRNLCAHSVRIVLSGQAERETILRVVQHAHQYISKPCDAEKLKHVIRQACALKKEITDISLREFIAQIRCLPVKAPALQAVRELLLRSDQAISQVADLIAQDIGMSSKLLQLVNSSFFTSMRTANCRSAAEVLGWDLLRILVLDIKIFDSSEASNIDEKLHNDLHVHCGEAASLAREIALKANDPTQTDPEECYSAALLHEIGHLVLAQYDQEKHREFRCRTFLSWDELLLSEKQYFGATHEEVGAYLLRLWGFSEQIVRTAGRHHSMNPTETNKLMKLLSSVDVQAQQVQPVESVLKGPIS